MRPARAIAQAALRGYRMPAEWEAHAATWLAWPHQIADWPRKFAPIPWVFAECVRHLVVGERVRILVNDATVERGARQLLERVGVDLSLVDFLKIRTDRAWTRDTLPLFLHKSDGGTVLLSFRFNGWARYRNHKNDAAVGDRLAKTLGLPQSLPEVDGQRVVLEGGAIDVNGRGMLLATEESLLSPVQARNPELSRDQMEDVLRETLGIRHILWLAEGIAGDDTHGRIDNVARFAGPRTVLVAQEDDPRDENHERLRDARRRLELAKDQDGHPLHVVPLPMPSPLYFEGQRLPASYVNFYVANEAVLVPTFNDVHDRRALEVLAQAFPDRRVVGIHSVDLVWGLGAIHCMTQQEPG
ncbi:MAG: agmatine/peptidylarginine deiminase [Myxococcales bacterium]